MVEFTKRAKRVINEMAGEEARRLGHDFVGPEHIFLGLLREEDSVAVKILLNLNINLNELRREVEKKSREDNLLMDIPSSQDRYQRIVEASKDEAKRMKHNYVGTEHILLALLKDNNNIVAGVLSTFGVNYNVIKSEILRLLGVQPAGTAGVASGSTQQQGSGQQTAQRAEKSKTPILDEFARDLTQLARDKKLDPVIGRHKEIERVIQILSRKTKNNPVLIGESGVGKTAIVEGLAIAIVEKTVPELLFEKRVLSLDLAGLIAGTKYRGEFEERLKKIMKEITSSTNIIIFIDELHTLIGAGAAEGAVDAANILKPALARGELQCIGATTNTEYRKYIEKDSALERRFQTVKVAEPSVEDAIKILEGLKKSYESHHKVRYTQKALQQSVMLSHRYINDRFLPDKAIDIIDEAGSKARLANCGRPDNVKQLEEEEIKQLTQKKEDLVRSQEYEKAASVRDEVNRKKLLLEEMVKAWQEKLETQAVTIDEDQILAVVSMWTGIPLEKMEESENEKLINMEKILKERIVGQGEAIEKIARAVRRARTGFKNEKRPTGSFIFLGPTGVGKTELAKTLAAFLFGKGDHLLRIDMSEYMEPHAVSRLIGAPPGYVGYDDGGQLTEFVRRKPYSVVLLDEIEKAHHDIFNVLLQIMEEGNLTDSKGRKVNFRDTILIMTSNIGAKEIQKGGRIGFEDYEGDKEKNKSEVARDELKKYFSPEFLNRVDEVVYFHSLKKEEIVQIVDIMLKDFNSHILEKKLTINMTKEAKEHMAHIGYDQNFGARPLRRVFQRELEDYLAGQLLSGAYKMPTIIKMDMKENKFLFTEEPWEDYGFKDDGSDKTNIGDSREPASVK